MASLAVSAALMGVRCAHVEPPPGGPIDIVPPAVAAVFPAPGAANVRPDAPVVFKFSEWIDRTAPRTQVFVSPPFPGRLKVTIDGDELRVRFPRPLRANTAYRVTVLGSLKDLHGVPMGRRFPLFFTTGTRVDSGGMTGTVSAPAPQGPLMAALYWRGGRNRAEASSVWDTAFRAGTSPQPWRELPAFLATADSSGAFSFDSVSQGDYSLFVFEDANGNFSFDPGAERAAVGEISTVLRPRAPEVFLRVAPADTARLHVSSAEFSGDSIAPGFAAGVVRIKFTHDPQLDSALTAGRYRLLPDSGPAVTVPGAGPDPQGGSWLLDAPRLRLGDNYRVVVSASPDFPRSAGTGKPDTSASFTVKPGKGTDAWTLTFLQKAGPSGTPAAQNASALLPSDVYRLGSSYPLTDARWKALQTRLAVRMEDSTPARIALRRLGPQMLSIQLPRALKPAERLELRLEAVPGDTASRSATLAAGAGLDAAHTGGLRFDVPARWRGWTFWLQAGAGAPEYVFPRGASAELKELPAGRYALYAFQDRDGDGAWYPGSILPWIPQEPFAQVLPVVEVVADEQTDIGAKLPK